MNLEDLIGLLRTIARLTNSLEAVEQQRDAAIRERDEALARLDELERPAPA